VDLLVNIDVPDHDGLARAVALYTALGLRVGRRFGADAVELVGGSAPIYLLVKPEGTAPAPGATRSYTRHWTPVHLDLVVDDGELEAAVERARAAGATVEREISEHAWGRLCVLVDPFGHGFCLLSFRGRGYDAIAT
jgi:catechol 2,3-dioxygenase-like lactoylglutathione lyase family enzyme